MVAVVQNNLEGIIKICKEMHVQSLYLFGSAAIDNRFTNNSDLDFLYQFKDHHISGHVLQYDYFDLMFSLEKLTGKKIDLVAEEKIKNKFFLERLNREKIKIYES